MGEDTFNKLEIKYWLAKHGDMCEIPALRMLRL